MSTPRPDTQQLVCGFRCRETRDYRVPRRVHYSIESKDEVKQGWAAPEVILVDNKDVYTHPHIKN